MSNWKVSSATYRSCKITQTSYKRNYKMLTTWGCKRTVSGKVKVLWSMTMEDSMRAHGMKIWGKGKHLSDFRMATVTSATLRKVKLRGKASTLGLMGRSMMVSGIGGWKKVTEFGRGYTRINTSANGKSLKHMVVGCMFTLTAIGMRVSGKRVWNMAQALTDWKMGTLMKAVSN